MAGPKGNTQDAEIIVSYLLCTHWVFPLAQGMTSVDKSCGTAEERQMRRKVWENKIYSVVCVKDNGSRNLGVDLFEPRSG